MPTEESTARRIGVWLCDLALILAVCLLLFFHDIGSTPFYDKQEAREALVIWEINHSGNWVLPIRNGEEIPAKPPFYHWLGAVAASVIGRVDELTVRLPSAVLGTAGVILTYAAGVFLWGRSAGLIAALVLSTSFEWLAARQARVDMALTFVLMFISFFPLSVPQWRRPNQGGHPWCLVGYGDTGKGPSRSCASEFYIFDFPLAEERFGFFKKAATHYRPDCLCDGRRRLVLVGALARWQAILIHGD